MKRVLFIALLFVFAFPSAAQAKIGVYAGPKLGASFVKISDSPFDDTSFSAVNLGMVAGYDMSVRTDLPVRFELDLTFRSGDDIDEGWGNYWMDISGVTTCMVNVWFDIPLGQTIKPYVGGGVGVGVVTFDVLVPSRSSNAYDWEGDNKSAAGFAYNLGAGVGIKVNHLLTLDLGYRFLGGAKYETDFDHRDIDEYKFSVRSHDVSAALRFTF